MHIPAQGGNRDRFVNFLKKFSDWDNGHKISLPHLFQLLQKNPEPAFSELRSHVIFELEKWQSGEIVTLNRESEIGTIKKLWPKEKEHQKLLSGLGVESLQHWNLFTVIEILLFMNSANQVVELNLSQTTYLTI